MISMDYGKIHQDSLLISRGLKETSSDVVSGCLDDVSIISGEVRAEKKSF